MAHRRPDNSARSGSANSRAGFIGDAAKIVPCMGRSRSTMTCALKCDRFALQPAQPKKFHGQLRLEASSRRIFENFSFYLFHYCELRRLQSEG
jgi:hypothetical protein